MLLFLFQTGRGANYEKLLEKGDLGKMEKELEKEKNNISKTEEFYYYNFWRGVLLFQPKYKKQDPTKAYNIFINLQKKFIAITDMEVVKKINKKGIDNGVLTAYTDSACKYGLIKAEQLNTLEGYIIYIKTFELAHPEYKDTARAKRNQLAWNIVKKKDTEGAYNKFITTYPYADQVQLAKERIVQLNYNKAKETNTTRSYAMFVSKFPDAKQTPEMMDSLYKFAFLDAQAVDLADIYAQYNERYPKSPYCRTVDSLMQDKSFTDFIIPNSWSSYITFLNVFPSNKKYHQRALDSLKNISLRQKSAKGLLYYLDNCENISNKDALVQKLYAWMSKDGELSTLDYFKTKFPKAALTPAFEKDYKAAKMAEALDLRNIKVTDENKSQVENYIKTAGDKDLAQVAMQKLLRERIKAKDWDGAVAVMNKLQVYTKNNQSIKEMRDVLARPLENGIEVKKIGATASKKGNEYYPVISADGKKLYFCGRDREDNIGGEDVFVSELVNNNWSKPKVFAPLSGKGSNDGMMAVSADGTQIIKFENGVMGVSTKGSKGWDEVQFFPPNINRGSWNCDATFCSDGSTLLFTSIRPSSADINQTSIYHGNNHYESDIYVSHRDTNGFWSEPINLGPKVNTIYSERTPYMHPDMKTLYFSTDGRGGLGGYDVFKVTRLADTCWTCWSEPVNVGKEINTADDDWTYKISTDGSTAYFSQKEQETNASNIYSIKLPHEQRPFNVVTISGKMVDHSNKKVVTEVVWEDLETNQIIGRAKTDPQDGSYFIVLPTGKLYGIYVNDSTVYPETRHIDLREHKDAAALTKTFHVTTIKELQQGHSITINNIFFDFGKSNLLKFSYPELKRLAKLLIKMNLKVEISGHTDNVGSDEANLRMSRNRAESVKNFLVKQGCNPENIQTEGYGASKPIADNDTEDGRARNRRVEMKVIK